MYPGVGTFVLTRPTQTFYERINLTFAASHSVEDTVSICSTIQDLVTIGLDAPSAIAKLSLSPSTQLKDSSRRTSEWIELYAQFTGADTEPDATPPHPAKMLFTFEDIGGLRGVAKWVQIARKYQAVIGALVNHWYVSQLYVDLRFFNAYTAAEALRRIQLGEQSINMDKELKVLAEQAGSTFAALVGDVDSWIKRVVQVRNNRVVHRGLHESAEGGLLYLLSESIYFLVVLCLLRECNVPADTLTKMQEHQRFRLLAKDLKALG